MLFCLSGAMLVIINILIRPWRLLIGLGKEPPLGLGPHLTPEERQDRAIFTCLLIFQGPISFSSEVVPAIGCLYPCPFYLVSPFIEEIPLGQSPGQSRR